MSEVWVAVNNEWRVGCSGPVLEYVGHESSSRGTWWARGLRRGQIKRRSEHGGGDRRSLGQCPFRRLYFVGHVA